MLSIVSNESSQVALSALAAISSQGKTIRNQLSTGLKVSGAADDAGVFSVAQGIRATLQGYDAANASLQDAQNLVSVAIDGATTVSNLLSTVTTTLTSLADGSISDQQRQTYTAQFVQELNEIQTVIGGSSYNGTNLIGLDLSQTSLVNRYGYPQPVPQGTSVAITPEGNELAIPAFDISGALPDSVSTTGFLGFLRLGYLAGGSPYASTNDLVSSNPVYVGYDIYDLTPVSRSEIQQNEALAALAPVSEIGNAFLTSPSATSGVASVFNSALAVFSQQVDSALGGLAQTNENIQLQITYNQSVTDILTDSLGNLVDANMATVSAELTAQQTREQLAAQALSVANAAPQTVLQLFQK